MDDTSPLFSDVENGRWSHAAIAYLISKGAISGYGDNTFKPETSITRAEFVKIAASAFSLVYEKPDGVDETQDSFALSDVSESDWYYPYVRGAADAKAVTGDNNGRFNPHDKISREEAAAIILRIASIKGINADAGTKIEIKDISDISDWAYTSVIQLMKMGIISGYSDGTFRPNGDITREEASKLIYELMYKMNGGVKID